MSKDHPRMNREYRTVEAMITIYCRRHHGTRDELCPDCKELLDYAFERLDRCPFQEGKTTCVNCPVHCYKPAMRERIRAVMRYAGPRIPFRHPILALFHTIDSMQKEPARPKRTKGDT